MRAFGPVRWNPSPVGDAPMCETPVGEPCAWCSEPIAVNDLGVIRDLIKPTGVGMLIEHRECFLRGIIGSIGHQRRRCMCFGGRDEDPPGMSRRQAARAAVEFALAFTRSQS